MHEDVARLLTSNAPAAIAVIELAGPTAFSVLSSHWSPKTETDTEWSMNRIRLGEWRNLVDRSQEEVVTCRTGEFSFELVCHGGKQAASRILRDLQSSGVEIDASPFSEAPLRTTIGQMLSHRSAWDALLPANILRAAHEDIRFALTERTTAILLDQMRGALITEIARVQSLVEKGCISDAVAGLERLMDSYSVGKHLIHPYRVVLAGPPNVGKSSLMNALLGYRRSIVHDQAGTTRDAIQSNFYVHGWPILLSDTAGIRESNEEVEQQGIVKSRSQLQYADLVLLLVDAAQDGIEVYYALMESTLASTLFVETKTDLAETQRDAPNAKDSALEGLKARIHRQGEKLLRTSAVTREGIDPLMDAMIERLVRYPLSPFQAVLFRESQWRAVAAWKSELCVQISHRSY